jgi:propanol-preferring alcohol dehydrogenase
MKAAIFDSAHTDPGSYVWIGEVPRPVMEAGHVLLRVAACGVCRTDLHIVERRSCRWERESVLPGWAA